MPQTVVAMAHRFAWNARLLDQLLEGFCPEDWWHDIGGLHACWVVGHLTIRRRQAMTMIGLSVPSAVRVWERCFRHDADPSAVPRHVVPDELVLSFHEFTKGLASHWDQISAADLLAPVERPFPDGSRTVGAGLRYVVWNETLHLGQLCMVRRILGKPPVGI